MTIRELKKRHNNETSPFHILNVHTGASPHPFTVKEEEREQAGKAMKNKRVVEPGCLICLGEIADKKRKKALLRKEHTQGLIIEVGFREEFMSDHQHLSTCPEFVEFFDKVRRDMGTTDFKVVFTPISPVNTGNVNQ